MHIFCYSGRDAFSRALLGTLGAWCERLWLFLGRNNRRKREMEVLNVFGYLRGCGLLERVTWESWGRYHTGWLMQYYYVYGNSFFNTYLSKMKLAFSKLNLVFCTYAMISSYQINGFTWMQCCNEISRYIKVVFSKIWHCTIYTVLIGIQITIPSNNDIISMSFGAHVYWNIVMGSRKKSCRFS